MMDFELYGRKAFEAYKLSKQGTTYDNKVIPEWEQLGDAVRRAWIEAAEAVVLELKETHVVHSYSAST